MRRAAALALVLAGLLAAPAGAARPVAGGESFNTAAEVAPGGSYSDAIAPGQTNVYRVQVLADRRLTATAALDASALTTEVANGSVLTVSLHGPLRQQLADAQDTGAGDPNTHVKTVSVEGPPAGARDTPGGGYPGPGAWYVMVSAGPAPDPGSAAPELPLTLSVRSEGNTVVVAPTRAKDDEGGISWGLVTGLGIAALVAGVLTGAAIGRVRAFRRERSDPVD